MPTLIDVVIPTARFSDRVAGLLADLQRELRPFAGQVGRIVVVDDQAVTDVGSELLSDGSRVITDWPSDSNGPAINRNRGARDAQSRWLAFLDDDVRLEPGWGTATVSLLSTSMEAQIIGGAIGSQHPRNWFSQASEDFVVRHREYPEGWYLAAAHLFVRTSAFEGLGGFDTKYAYGAEDWDFCRRAHAIGLTVDAVTQPRVAHANPTTWAQLRRKAEQYGRANATFDEPEPQQANARLSDAPAIPVESRATGLPGPLRGLRWARGEYGLLRNAGRGRWRAVRTVTLYVPWMAVYLRAQSQGGKASS